MVPPAMVAEQSVLRAMLGCGDREPIYLDFKPPIELTDRERRALRRRLRTVTGELDARNRLGGSGGGSPQNSGATHDFINFAK